MQNVLFVCHLLVVYCCTSEFCSLCLSTVILDHWQPCMTELKQIHQSNENKRREVSFRCDLKIKCVTYNVNFCRKLNQGIKKQHHFFYSFLFQQSSRPHVVQCCAVHPKCWKKAESIDFFMELSCQFSTHCWCDFVSAGFCACFQVGKSKMMINSFSPSLTITLRQDKRAVHPGQHMKITKWPKGREL